MQSTPRLFNYNGTVSGVITTSELGVVSGSLTGDYNVTVAGQVTDVDGANATFEGTITGDVEGSITGTLNSNGIDTLLAYVTGTDAVQTVRIVGIFPQTGIDGDFIGEVITGPEPDYVEAITVTGESSVAAGSTLQLGTNIIPSGAADDVLWSVYVDDRDYASISDSGLVTGIAAGTATIIVKAADGSHVYGTKVITITET
jgi:uncharacterized protein YjdB